MNCAGGNTRVAFVKPTADRTEQVASPAIPEAKTPCAYDPSKLCLNDEQTATVIGGLAGALDAANAKLQWLADFFNGLGRSATK